MTMYTIAGTPVTQEEFARAAKVCIGKSLNKEVVSTVFDIFDVDGECMWCVRGERDKERMRGGRGEGGGSEREGREREREILIIIVVTSSSGDGRLSYREFLVVMKNWKLRGSKVIVLH